MNDCDISSRTYAKISKDRFPIRSDIIESLCRTYHLKIEEVIVFNPDSKLISKNKDKSL